MRSIVISFSGLFLLLIAACGQNKEQIIQQKVAERVAEFKQKKIAECRQALLTDAEHIADSLLMQDALNQVLDSMARLRPFRPTRPATIPPIDTTRVKPIFDK